MCILIQRQRNINWNVFILRDCYTVQQYASLIQQMRAVAIQQQVFSNNSSVVGIHRPLVLDDLYIYNIIWKKCIYTAKV